MKLKALITSLALVGSMSSAALADTTVSASFHGSVSWGSPTAGPVVAQGPVVRDHRTFDRFRHRPERHPEPRVIVNNTKVGRYSEYVGRIGTVRPEYGLVALTEPTRIDNSREDFTIGPSAGVFNTLQLRPVAGTSYIRKVTIEFMNNEAQVVQIESTLDARTGAININVDGRNRQIKRIFVYGSTNAHSAYQILAG